MATKIGFDAKLAGTGVDWATVGKDVSETLIQQEQQREKNRVAMDKAVADEIKTLAGTELGKDAQANQWIMNGVGAITGSSLMDSRLLKNGLLSSRDFSRNLANRTQGTELVLQAYNTYNKDYDEIMEKINSGDLSEKTLQARAQVESMFDFANTDIFINPTDSEVNVSKKVLKDGVMVMSDNPDDFMNASELMQGATAQYARFQANDEAKALADAVAQRLIRDIGGETIEGAYQAVSKLPTAEQDKLDAARKLQIQAVLTDDKAGSFLVDTLNKTLEPGKGPYSFTKNKDEAARDEYKILMNQDGSNNFTTKNGKKQMKLAVEKFDVMLEGFLPAKRTAPLPKAPKTPQLSSGERVAQKEGEIGYGLALDLTAGGATAGESLQKIKANNNSIGNVYETDTSYVIQYNDGTSDKTIDKIMRDGVEAREESAVSLMAAVSPKYDATKAETAKQGYLKSNKIGERTEKGLFGERTSIATENSSTYQTKLEVAKGDKGVSISEQIKKLPDPDEDSSSQVLDVIKDIYPLPGTESFINQIQVTGVGTGIDDVLNIKLPEELIPFVQDVGGVNVDGQNVSFDYDSKKDKATLKSVIDGIIAGMYDIYNKKDARKNTEDNPDAVPVEAGTTTGTTGNAKGDSILKTTN